MTWRGQGHALHLCLFCLQRKCPRSTNATRVHSTHGVLNLFLAPFTLARRRIDHKGFTSFHRNRPPILIVSGNLGSTTLLGHARVSCPETEHEGRLRCLCSPATDRRAWPCPRNSTAARPHFPRLLCWQLLQGRNSKHDIICIMRRRTTASQLFVRAFPNLRA